MSNNIYDILKKMAGLEQPKTSLTEGKKVCSACGKAKCSCVHESAKPDYIDLDKDGNKKESMKKAAKDKEKGAIAEAVARVEQQLSEKYMGFKKTAAAIKKGGSAENPEAVAAAIGRKKYGKEKFQKAAAAGKKLGEGEIDDFYKSPRIPGAYANPEAETRMGNALAQAHLDKQQWERSPAGKAAAAQAKSEEEAGLAQMAKRDAQLRAMQQQKGKVQESDLEEKWDTTTKVSPEEKGKYAGKSKAELLKAYNALKKSGPHKRGSEEFGRMRELAFAIRAKGGWGKVAEADMEEGNKFTGNLMKARAQGLKKADLDGDGDMETVHEGFEDLEKYMKSKKGPESKGSAGKKAGHRYGGSAQQDDSEDLDGEGKPVEKKKGRPKGTGGGAKHSFKKAKD